MSPLERKETMEVLRDELEMMDKGMSYRKAHKLANGIERRIEKEWV